MSNLHKVELTKDEMMALAYVSQYAISIGMLDTERNDYLIGGLCEIRFVLNQIQENGHE
jgi:hypothetical protein